VTSLLCHAADTENGHGGEEASPKKATAKFKGVGIERKAARNQGTVLMPRYFFNVYHDRAELDKEGEELPDLQAAWREATVTVGQIIQDLDGRLRPGKDWRMEVTDEFANLLYVIHVCADKSR
jgi:hypothetical protein